MRSVISVTLGIILIFVLTTFVTAQSGEAAKNLYIKTNVAKITCPGDIIKIEATGNNQIPVYGVAVRLLAYEPYLGVRQETETDENGIAFLDMSNEKDNVTYQIELVRQGYAKPNDIFFKFFHCKEESVEPQPLPAPAPSPEPSPEPQPTPVIEPPPSVSPEPLPAPQPTPTPAPTAPEPTPTPAPTPQPVPTPTQQTTGFDLGQTLVPLIVGMILAFGLGYYLGSKRKA